MVVNETIGRLCPLQDDVRAVFRVVGEEASVQPLALLLQYAYSNLDAGLTNLLYAASLHFGKRVYATYNHPFDCLANDEVSARRRLAIVGTRLQGHIDG